MKKFILISFLVLFCHSLFSQVGIGNTDPKSTLDISATNAATPSNTDGILIPRVDDFPATNPTVDQDGMMVFATGNGTPSKGFYYWDNGSTSWIAISSGGGSDDDWYEENTTSPPTSNSADIFTDGNVGIGLSNVLYPLQIESPASSRTMSLLNENTGTSVTGIYNNIDESAAAASGSANGIVNSITRSNQSSISGVSNSFQNSTVNAGFAYLFGYQNSFGTSTSNTTFALINRFQGTTGTAYGTSNLIGGPITNFYGVDNHNIAGANLSGTFYGLYNSLTGSDSGDRYGVYTSFAETGSGDKYGEFITIATSAGGTHYGVYSDVQNGTGYAGYFLGRTSLGNGTTNRYLMPASDGTAGQVMTTDGAGNISFTTPSSGGGTLDQAYDFGGAGAGRTITADSGAVLIGGEDGFQNTGTFGSGATLALSGGGTRMFFYPRKAAFRAGNVTSNQWNDINVGDYSFAVGQDNTASGSHSNALGRLNTTSGVYSNALGRLNTASGAYSNVLGRGNTASGEYAIAGAFSNTASGNASLAIGNTNVASGDFAVALGFQNNASGFRSFVSGSSNQASGFASSAIGFNNAVSGLAASVFGYENTAPSAYEFVVGTFNTSYTPMNPNNYDVADRIFTVGNGTGTAARSNALTIYKSGLMNINDAYNMPLTDGTNGQVLTTNGAGQLSFSTLSLTDTDDQTIDQFDLSGTTLRISLEDDGQPLQTVDLSSLQDGNTQNTLDQAYDEGGVGAGRFIDAFNGAVTIQGYDGLLVTGTFNAGAALSTSGIGDKMFFYPKKGAFRAGAVGSGGIFDSTAWDDANIGARSFAVNIGTIASASYSFASGVSTEASGYASTAMGYISEASGWYSTAMGEGTIATGWGEMAVGSYNSTGTSRVFVVGNGTSDASRSNAFEVYDSGLIRFNDAYSFPTIDGSANQVLRTNGAGTVTWATLSGEATTASNGLTETGNDVRLGGTLTQNTTINNGNFDLEISSTGSATEGLSITKTDNAASSNIALDIIKTTNGTGFGTGVNVSMNGTGNGSLYSYSANITNSGSGTKIAYDNVFSGSGTGTLYANRNQFLGSGSGSKYGVHNTFGTSVTSVKFGVYNDFDSSSGNYYGMTNNMVGATNSAVFGVNNTLSGTGTGAKTGVSNSFSGANGNANIYIGMDNSFNDTGNGDRWGVRTNLDGTGTGTHYGSFNDLTGTGSGTKYGTYNSISSGAGGTHYGTYNEVNNSNGWAGYFMGKNYVSDAIGINNPNPDGRLDIIHNSTSETSPHIMITAQNANSGSRITFDNAAETTNSWVLFARADDTPGAGVLNFYSSEITANVLRLESDGKIGIMRNPTTNALEVEGNASKTTAGAFVANSDRRLKKEIKSISGETALDKIEKMRGVTYLWNDNKTGAKRPEGLQYGFIAQELMEIFPEKVTMDNLGYYQTAYGDYDPIFVEAIKELKTEVDTLKDENQKLKEQLSKMENIEARLSALEANNSSNNTSGITSEKKK